MSWMNSKSCSKLSHRKCGPAYLPNVLLRQLTFGMKKSMRSGLNVGEVPYAVVERISIDVMYRAAGMLRERIHDEPSNAFPRMWPNPNHSADPPVSSFRRTAFHPTPDKNFPVVGCADTGESWDLSPLRHLSSDPFYAGLDPATRRVQ